MPPSNILIVSKMHKAHFGLNSMLLFGANVFFFLTSNNFKMPYIPSQMIASINNKKRQFSDACIGHL